MENASKFTLDNLVGRVFGHYVEVVNYGNR
jgi:hypothetical protein